jgi:hypothetical protein
METILLFLALDSGENADSLEASSGMLMMFYMIDVP